MTYSITRFALYDMMKDTWKRMARKDSKSALRVWELGVCAGLSGGIAGLVGNPAEVRGTLLITGRKAPRCSSKITYPDRPGEDVYGRCEAGSPAIRVSQLL
jgi:hypothetical protein